MSAEATPRPDDTAKLYYSIREVSELLDVKPHVLRYWESQFRTLRPKKSRAGNRMYRPKDVDQLREIQHLLHVLRYTIAGARQELQRRRRSEPEPEDAFSADFEGEPEAFHAEEWDPAGATSHPDGSSSVQESRPAIGAGEELELFPIHEPKVEDSGGRSVGAVHGAKETRGEERGLPPTALPGVSRADLAPLRDEIRQLKEWLEAGIIGARNRG